MFEIEFTDQAIEDLQWFKKHEQNVIVDGIEANLCYEPTTETRNRKPLRPNNTAEWELRVGLDRVLYNVDQQVKIVSIERIAGKPGNKYIFQGEEEELS
ncbi:type II toxin-antitoxin system RelE/ParE family toxin [Microcoleus sp. herbarium14]|uniref:type II toxin-antitoxin system RelE family toxin n=1 Tax=Microcoleus sp. herbarium14 TaxID=3055439 RepID=UPI002FD3DA91